MSGVVGALGLTIERLAGEVASLRETNEALQARLEAAEAYTKKLVAALRSVQLDHSRALIDIGEDLERRIAELIGPHPRDGQ